MQDLRLALRALRATPIVSAVAILSLALGIGANTAIFSLVNSLLLRSLPVVEPQYVAVVSDDRPGTAGWPYRVWDQIRQRAQPFDGSCAWMTDRFNLSAGGGETQPVDGIYASGDYFTTLGVSAVLGRTFTPADDVLGGGTDGPVAVISYSLWQRRFGGSGNIIGTRLLVERVPFTVIGVTPRAFFGAEVGRAFDVALPLNAERMIRGADSRIGPESGYFGLTVVLRLKAGQTIDAATAILRGVQPQIRAAVMPPTLPPLIQKEFLTRPFTVVQAASGTSRLRARFERPLVAILVVVALVLLIACANIANLQLARAAARRHELSIRVALGAPRWRLMRRWLVESLLLSTIGSLLGLLFAAWGSRALVAQLSSSSDRVYLDLSLDWRVLAFTVSIAIGTAVLFGTLPALRAARVAPVDALKEQGRGLSADTRVNLSSGLVVVQVALSLVIVVAAGLFVRSFKNLITLPLGFDTDRVLLVNVNVARTHVSAGDRIALFERLTREASAAPGVANAASSLITPVVGGGMVDVVRVPGAPLSLQAMNNGRLAEHSTFLNYITPGWFRTYGTPIRAGRDFDERDVREAPLVIIVNEAFVRKFMSDKRPIGASVAFERGGAAPVYKTVIGVVADAAYGSLRDEASATEYAPLAQFDFRGSAPGDISLSLRSSAGSPMLMARSVSTALLMVDPDLVFSFRPLEEQVSASLTQERLVALLSGFFGALALLLAGLGLYGVTSYAVNRRRAEIGIRMALGAAPGSVVRLVLRRVAILVAIGVLVGAAASAWVTKFVAALLYGLEPRDPMTLVGAAVILAAVGTVAAWLPAYRASRIDPAETLRDN